MSRSYPIRRRSARGTIQNRGGRCPRLDAELPEDPLEMLGHRARACPEDDADLAVGLAFRDPRQDLRLARAQPECRERLGGDRATPLADEQGALSPFGQPDL